MPGSRGVEGTTAATTAATTTTTAAATAAGRGGHLHGWRQTLADLTPPVAIRHRTAAAVAVTAASAGTALLLPVRVDAAAQSSGRRSSRPGRLGSLPRPALSKSRALVVGATSSSSSELPSRRVEVCPQHGVQRRVQSAFCLGRITGGGT
jgi:hypothetical protein